MPKTYIKNYKTLLKNIKETFYIKIYIVKKYYHIPGREDLT